MLALVCYARHSLLFRLLGTASYNIKIAAISRLPLGTGDRGVHGAGVIAALLLYCLGHAPKKINSVTTAVMTPRRVGLLGGDSN